MNKLLWHSSLALATAASLTACDDDITEITKTGIESVNAYENLAKCEDKNDGEMVFVKDSGAVYLCSDKKWNDINGKDGKNGNDGKSAYEIAKENGFKGTETEWLKSLKGESGEGCAAKSVENGVEITCGNSDPLVIHNGTNGTNASDDCKITDDKVEGIYGKVKIGQKNWMTQNLKYETKSSKCGGGNETEEDCTKYGRLYTLEDAMGKTAQGICPDGWRLPFKDDWERLIAAVNTSDNEKNNAGLHLKANSDLWIDYEDQNKVTQSGAGDNTSGFTALPCGRYSMGKFLYSGEAAYFWSTTETGSNSAYYMVLMNDSDEAAIGYIGKDYMYSVRCTQDTP